MYVLNDLLYLMSRLRDRENGCQWDLEQSPETIINYSIEEVYELADAVEHGEINQIVDELGDVLFQVIFLARFGEESGSYDFAGVVDHVCNKLIRRHPHVFPGGVLYTDSDSGITPALSAEQVREQWEVIKRQERKASGKKGLFDNVPRALPALGRAARLQKKAAAIGLDWPDASGPLDKLEEELGELQNELHRDEVDKAAVQRELGDLLFTAVNLSRKLNINAEQALRDASARFERRASYVEQQLLGRQCISADDDTNEPRVSASEVSAGLLDRWWEEAKNKS